MTLHEAIELILHEQGMPMTPADIAEIINKRRLYARKDGLPVSEFQINFRVENHQEILNKEFDKVRLVIDDTVTQHVFKYQRQITNTPLWQKDQAENFSRKAFINSLKEVLEGDNGN